MLTPSYKFSFLNKCQGKLDCLIYEMLFYPRNKTEHSIAKVYSYAFSEVSYNARSICHWYEHVQIVSRGLFTGCSVI